MYNAEKWISTCIESLISQTIFNETEILIIDDGSTDGSSIIAQKYVDKWDNIFLYSIKNAGVSHARNFGIDHAKGDFISFVDSDDYLDKYFLDNLLTNMNEECEIVCSGFIAEYKDKSVIKSYGKDCQLNNKEAIEAFLQNTIIDPNVTDKLFRKSLISDKRFSEKLAIAEDRMFLFDCLLDTKGVNVTSKAYYHYIMNDTSACNIPFNANKFATISVAKYIFNRLKAKDSPKLIGIAESMIIDSKCQVVGDLYTDQNFMLYYDEYKKLLNDINSYSVLKKYKYSNKKHFFAFLAMRIHPKVYKFLKENLELKYK